MDRLPEVLTRPGEVATDGVGRNTHRPRDLVIGFPFETDQYHRLPLSVRHPAQRTIDVSECEPGVVTPRLTLALRIGVNPLGILGPAGFCQTGEELITHDGNEPGA